MLISNFGSIVNIKSTNFLPVKRHWNYLTVSKSLECFKYIFLKRSIHGGGQNKYNNFIPFINVVKTRQNEAKRSILVQVQSVKSHKELLAYCSQYGEIKEMFHYKAEKEQLHFILIEFQKENSVKQVLNHCNHIDDSNIIPVESTFLWFKACKRGFENKIKKNPLNLTIENGNSVLSENELKKKLQSCNSISDQIEILYNTTKLNDLGTRLRFLTAKQIEVCLSGMFPNATAFPFGSSVNGFGKMNCDLDVVLRLTEQQTLENNRLIYHCKTSGMSERLTSQRHMETIGDLINLFLPGCSQVRKILQARVPIIKYYQSLTDVECDLSITNMSGVHMSDMLHIWGSMDERVRPLVFVVKKWAQEVGLTNNFPGRWITNFSLTLLVLAFLQKPKDSPPILPSLNDLVKAAGSDDKYITEDGVDCSFLRDIRKLRFKTDNEETLESLLMQFFEYYSTFDFEKTALCLNHAGPVAKPEHSALYIVNPLEKGLNVSKNVSAEEMDRLKLELRNSLWIIQSKEKKDDNWGILSLFNNRKVQLPNILAGIPIKSQTRLMDVTKIFEDEKDLKHKKENVEDGLKGFAEVNTSSEVNKKNVLSRTGDINNLEINVERKTGN